MTKVTGWDTDGITGLKALGDGRIVLEFTGKDGSKRNIFVPGDAIPPIVASLVGLSAALAQKTGGKDALAGKHMMGVKGFTVGSDDRGREFVLALTTGDNLELRFGLDGNLAEAIAAALVSTLEQHGRSLSLLKPSGSKH